jgi:hypothetical protein
MSDLRVALVAEGPTDAIVIGAALKALLPRSFVLTQLQPEPTRPKLGAGWGGVLQWCRDFATRGHLRFEDDPTLPGFDLFVVHVDADVAESAYADVSNEIANIALQRGWPALPNSVPCPPPTGSVDFVRTCVLSWAGLQAPGPKTALCVPSKAVDAWLAAATLDNGHALLTSIECNLNVGGQLAVLPMAQRIKKTKREYLVREQTVTEGWPVVRAHCTQAERFSTEIAAIGCCVQQP